MDNLGDTSSTESEAGPEAAALTPARAAARRDAAAVLVSRLRGAQMYCASEEEREGIESCIKQDKR